MAATLAPPIGRAGQLFHALSDETRLEIVRLLARGERCVCELTDELDAAQSRLSFHLKTLKSAGLVNDRRAGRWVYYSLNAEAVEELATLVDALLAGDLPRGRTRQARRRALPVTEGCC